MSFPKQQTIVKLVKVESKMALKIVRLTDSVNEDDALFRVEFLNQMFHCASDLVLSDLDKL